MKSLRFVILSTANNPVANGTGSFVASRLLRMTLVMLVSFFIFYLLSFIFPSPAFAAETTRTTNIRIGPTCFTKQECEAEPYKGGPHLAQECQTPTFYHSQEAVNRGFTYNCYAKQPEVHLNVSIGGYKVAGLEQYLLRLYNYLVGIAGIVAGIMIVWAGVKWLTSAGMPDRITDAKKKIGNALIGIILVLGSYVILQTVNPALVELRLPPIKMAREFQEVAEVDCENIPQFHCGGTPTERRYRVDNETIPAAFAEFLADDRERGTYACAKAEYNEYNPCGSAGGECKGVFCQQGGCFDIRTTRVMAPALEKIRTLEGGMALLNDPVRGCFSRSECQPCESVQLLASENQLTNEGRYNLQLCVSAACNCILSLDDSENLACISRRTEGQHCRVTEECSDGLECMPTGRSLAYENFKCTRPPVAVDEFCLNDSQCESGLCSQSGAATPDNRIHIGICRNGANGEPCAGGAGGRCESGLHCVDSYGPGGICSDGRAGSPCDPGFGARAISGFEGDIATTQCQSGTCRIGGTIGLGLSRIGTCR